VTFSGLMMRIRTTRPSILSVSPTGNCLHKNLLFARPHVLDAAWGIPLKIGRVWIAAPMMGKKEVW
jgi:hypothetical protein